MAIKQYSLAKDGARQLSPAFKVREFRCRDGSDAIMVDEALTVLLQAIREHFGKAVVITSGYRIPSGCSPSPCGRCGPPDGDPLPAPWS